MGGSPSYHVFVSHGFDADFVSPDGGKVKFMMDPLGISSYTIRYEDFMDKAASSFTSKQIEPSNYWSVFIGGGYGPLFDVANNKDLQLSQNI
ncbi:MAG: putative intracellular protease/amidase [Paraglaciecola sp.]|jgi:putative intracellular protease/amidase